MFSYVPYGYHNEQPFFRSRQNLYAQQLARERAQYAAALRAQRARELAMAGYDDDDGDFKFGNAPSFRSNSQQGATESARRKVQAEEEKRRSQESYHHTLDEVRKRNSEIEQEMKAEGGEKVSLPCFQRYTTGN
jgi:hypothetical protein